MENEELRNHLIDLYKRSLALNIDSIYDNYVYTYNEDLDELHLKSIIIIEKIMFILNIFDVVDSHCVEYDYELEEIHFGDRLKYISKRAFSNNVNLKTVIIEAEDNCGKLIIDAYAFYNCKSLITFGCKRNMIIKKFAFSKCRYLSDFPFENVLEIGYESFSEDELLKYVNLSSIQKLDNRSFWCCSRLLEVYIGENLLKLPSNCFSGCSSLREVIMDSDCEIENFAFGNYTSLYLLYYDNVLMKSVDIIADNYLSIFDKKKLGDRKW